MSVILSKACEYHCDIKPLLRSLDAFAPRWKNIHITALTLDDFEVFASLSAEDVPMLQDVVMECTLLFRLSISEGHIFAALNYPSKQSVHLRIMMLELLQQFPALENCEFVLAGEARNLWSGTPVILPIYVILGCATEARRVKQTLFASLVLPNLRSVEYNLFFPTPNPLPFSQLLPELECLSLNINGIINIVLLDYLRPAQRLEELQLAGNSTYPGTVWGFGPPNTTFFVMHFGPDSKEPLCPRLRRLQCAHGPEHGSVARLKQLSATLDHETADFRQ
ncbi:hypothetical protein C8R44DRAFT_866407 [Mycena epipterygia]|nr:hypothetical protein C8R44DRAFT_866407 [Mycena epipterygia]